MSKSINNETKDEKNKNARNKNTKYIPALNANDIPMAAVEARFLNKEL